MNPAHLVRNVRIPAPRGSHPPARDLLRPVAGSVPQHAGNAAPGRATPRVPEGGTRRRAGCAGAGREEAGAHGRTEVTGQARADVTHHTNTKRKGILRLTRPLFTLFTVCFVLGTVFLLHGRCVRPIDSICRG